MPDASHDFGAHLRQAREQRGVSLREIAACTKISVLVLEALEKNDVSRLPGGIFTRAFLRSYANEVGLDPEDTVRRFLARFPDESTEDGPRPYEPNPEHISVDEPPTFGRAWRAVAWSLPLLLVVAYFGFGGRLPWWGDRGPQPASRGGELPAAPPPPASPPAGPSASPPAGPSAGPNEVPASPGAQTAAPAVGPASLPAALQASLPATEPPSLPSARDAAQAPRAGAAGVPPGAPGAEAPVPAPQTAVPAATAGPPPEGAFRLTLAPREACWVSVWANGTRVFSGLMAAGERKALTLQGDVTLTVGNAGAFGYLINDQAGRALGGPGQVTTVRLNADNIKTFLEPR